VRAAYGYSRPICVSFTCTSVCPSETPTLGKFVCGSGRSTKKRRVSCGRRPSRRNFSGVKRDSGIYVSGKGALILNIEIGKKMKICGIRQRETI